MYVQNHMKTTGVLRITNGDLMIDDEVPRNLKRSIFLDTSKLEEVQKWNETGIIDGITSNQSIMLKDGIKPKDFEKVVKSICKEMGDKPVSVELTDSTASVEQMVKEAQKINALAENIVVKVPLIPDTTKSLVVIKKLAELDIAVNVTTMMTFEQMLSAALAARHCKRTSFLSIFWGRSIEDNAQYRSRFDFMTKHQRVGIASLVNSTPDNIVAATVDFLETGGYDNLRIIVGSIRTASQVGEAYAAGGHICTIPPDILQAMLFSQRSIETIEQFDAAWKELQAQK